MKKFFSSIFNTSPQVKNLSKEKEGDDLIDRLENEAYLSNEFRFQHQNEKYQLRATPNEKVTLGVLLNRTFDIRQEEVSDLYIVTDNIREKKGILVVDNNEIWDFDLCNAVLIKQDNGDIGYRFSENVILSISYRKGYVKQEDDDKSISRVNDNIIVHLRGCGGGKDTWFIRASIMLPTFSHEGDKTYTRTANQPQILSVLFAYDNTSPEQRIEEYKAIHDRTIEKFNNGEELEFNEYCIISQMIPTIGKDFYWGNEVLKENRYWDAIIYLENVYHALRESWLKGNITDEDKKMFYQTCYIMGYCYAEMCLYEKALFYLEIVRPLNNITYNIEYINCLANSRDIRAVYTIHDELNQLAQLKENEITDSVIYYHNFLRRRRAYTFVDMGRLDDAEEAFKEMLNEDANKEYAKGELKYIQELKKRESIEG